MSARPVLAAIVAAAAVPLAASAATGAIDAKVGPKAHSVKSGAALWIPVSFRCKKKNAFLLRVDVYQGDAAVLGTSSYQATCTGKNQTGAFRLPVAGKGRRTFTDGYAKACWIATVRNKLHFDDVAAGCNGLTIPPPK